MFKKYLFVLFLFVFSLTFTNKILAQNYDNSMPIIGTGFIEKRCTSPNLVSEQECIAYAITGFNDQILIGVYDQDSNQTLIVHQDQYYSDNRYALPSQSNPKTFSSNICNSYSKARDETTCQLNFAYNWGGLGVKVKDFITHDGIAQSSRATYQINILPAPIDIIGKVNGINFGWATLEKSKTLNITCTNSLSMKINGKEVGIGNSQNGYTINYAFKDTNPLGSTYTVLCENVATEKSQTFNTLNMTGNIENASCKIPLWESTCEALLKWSTQNAMGESEVTSPWPKQNTIIGNTNNGNKTVTIPYNYRDFYLYNSGVELDNIRINSECEEGVWDGEMCALNPTYYLTTENCFIPLNGSVCNAKVSWGVQNSAKGVELFEESTRISTNSSGANLQRPISFGTTYYHLKFGGTIVKSTPATAKCINGYVWNGTKCVESTISLHAEDCIIPSGAGSCNTTLSWEVNNYEGSLAVTSSYPAANTIISTSPSGSQSVVIPYNERKFYLYNNGDEMIPSVTVSASCAANTKWNETKKICESANVTATLGGSTCTIPSGGSTCQGSITWSTTNATDEVTLYLNGNHIFTGVKGNSELTTLTYGKNNYIMRPTLFP